MGRKPNRTYYLCALFHLSLPAPNTRLQEMSVNNRAVRQIDESLCLRRM
jgi:hypothetical protein